MAAHAGIYARISQDKNGRAEGVAEQIRWGREYAAGTWPGLPIVVYAENNISGTDDERPELNAMRQAIRDGQCIQVVTTYHSRLTRSYVWFQMAAEMLDAGVGKIHTRHDGIVEVGGLLGDILAVINTHAVKVMKEALMDRLDANAAKGEAPGSLPFGYRHALTPEGAKTYEQVPEQADAIRWAAARVLDGWSMASVETALRARGMPGAHQVTEPDGTKRPGRISATSIRNWLTKPTVAGFRVHRGQITGRGNWEPILDEDTWRACQAKLGGPRTVRRADGSTYPVTVNHTGFAGRKYLLTGGLIVCGVCGAPMVGSIKQLKGGAKRGGRDVAYYLCHPSRGGRACTGIMLAETEQHVLDALFAELDKPEFLDAIATDVHAARREQITTILAAIDGQRIELARLWGTPGALTMAEWLEAKAALADSERDLRAELDAKAPPPGRMDIERARVSWPTVPLDEKRAFVRRYIAKVTIMRARPGTKGFDPGRVQIDLAAT
jgi:site-specific DNA recombinase